MEKRKSIIFIKGGTLLVDGKLQKSNIVLVDNVITEVGKKVSKKHVFTIKAKGCFVMPGAIDAHVHLREPGFTQKETIASGTLSALKGGVTEVLAMPNVVPAPDCAENVDKINAMILKDSCVKTHTFGAITKGQNGTELSDMAEIADKVCGFSDDGKGVENLAVLKQAMIVAKSLNKIISSHAEAAGYGTSPEAEYLAVAREIELVREIGCKYHFCHLSTKQSFDLVRQAKKDGLDVTCEVTPHHLFLSEKDIKNTFFKMNPPLRSYEDMQATVEALLDGTADFIATDHAPHTTQEKSVDYDKAPNGIIGLETMLPLVYTNLIKTGKATYADFVRWTVTAARERFGLPVPKIEAGETVNIVVLGTNKTREYLAKEILSASENTPFTGYQLCGFPVFAAYGGGKQLTLWRYIKNAYKQIKSTSGQG